jgi:hypothetical protein
MRRRSTLTIALATAVFALGLYGAGSPAATAITFGLLIFLSMVTVTIGWEHLKDSILDEVEDAHRRTSPSLSNQAGAHEHELRRCTLGQADPVVRFRAGQPAEIDLKSERLASSFPLSRPMRYDAR